MGNHGSRSNACREEETRERLSSLIQQEGLTGGRDDCYWVLLAESSRDRFVILEGIHESCWSHAHNDEFQLVAAGSAASASEGDGCAVFWPAAKDLASVVHTIMRKKRSTANDSQAILQESAIRGLPICHLVGCKAQFITRPSTSYWSRLYRRPWFLVRSSPPALELEMQMLPRVLKPPSLLAAPASPLLPQGNLDDHDTASSSSAPLGLISAGMEMDNPSETAAGQELSPIGRIALNNINEELAAAAPLRFFLNITSISSGRRVGDVLVSPAVIALLIGHRWRDYDSQAQRRLELLMADLEAGGVGARRTGGGATVPFQETSEVAKMLQGMVVQAYAAFLPACVTAYPLLKDAPDHVKFTVFGGLAFITVGLFVGILPRSAPRRGLVIRLVSFTAVAVLTFSVASLLSSRPYIALTALVGVALNMILMLLPF